MSNIVVGLDDLPSRKTLMPGIDASADALPAAGVDKT
jgi:hypothetical protein